MPTRRATFESTWDQGYQLSQATDQAQNQPAAVQLNGRPKGTPVHMQPETVRQHSAPPQATGALKAQTGTARPSRTDAETSRRLPRTVETSSPKGQGQPPEAARHSEAERQALDAADLELQEELLTTIEEQEQALRCEPLVCTVSALSYAPRQQICLDIFSHSPDLNLSQKDCNLMHERPGQGKGRDAGVPAIAIAGSPDD